MRLGISNLVWRGVNLSDLVLILKNNGIEYIEIVLPKHLEWNNADLTNLYEFHSYFKASGIKITSTQSLFYGSKVESYYDDNFIDHLIKVSDICKEIEVTHLVLGAPTMRKGSSSVGLYDKFSYINSIVRENNQTLLLEPNSRIYGGDYFHGIEEIIDFINEIEATNIKTMIDTHNLVLEGEDPSAIFSRNKSYIEHVHVSEVDLDGFIKSEQHDNLASTLKENNYSGLIIYEAKPTSTLITEIENFSKTYNL